MYEPGSSASTASTFCWSISGFGPRLLIVDEAYTLPRLGLLPIAGVPGLENAA